MNRRDLIRQALCVLLADRVAGNAWATAQSNDRLKRAAEKGRQFLVDMFDATLGLLPEFRGASVYWLYHDNYLAAKVDRVTEHSGKYPCTSWPSPSSLPADWISGQQS